MLRLLSFVLLAGVSSVALADGVDDAKAALDKGDNATALALLQPLADQGDARAERALGYMYYNGKGVSQDYSQAIKLFRASASQGDAGGEYDLAASYARTARASRAMTTWRRCGSKKAADQGRVDGNGRTRRTLQHRPRRRNELPHRRRLAHQGRQPSAMPSPSHSLGLYYMNGYEVEQNYTHGADWIEKAANQDYAAAEMLAGQIYEKGLGERADVTQSNDWYRKAANDGYAPAVHLGDAYDQGLGVTQDYDAAFGWYLKAANQGDAAGEDDVGLMYWQGIGVPMDLVDAELWLDLSAAKGNPAALSDKKMVAAQMTADQITEAEDMAADWKSSTQAAGGTGAKRLASPPPAARQHKAHTEDPAG